MGGRLFLCEAAKIGTTRFNGPVLAPRAVPRLGGVACCCGREGEPPLSASENV